MNIKKANQLGHTVLKYRTIATVLLLLLFLSPSFAQDLNAQWEKELTKSLEQFMDCSKTSADKYSCATIGQSVAIVYQQQVLYSDKLKRYLAANEIAEQIKNNDRWTMIGAAYDQKVLNESQKLANGNKPVIAVYATSTGSHVALILPGELHYSGSWGYNVPNSASFAINDPSNSYVSKGLSYGFSKSMIKNITLYSRK